MSKKTEYINKYNKTHYDRINMFIPKGYKEQIKDRAKGLGIGMNDYIFQLILNDLNGVSESIAKQTFNEEDKEMLEKWQVTSRYFEMIESVSYSPGNYFIKLKAGYINDVSGNRYIHASNRDEIKRIVNKSHKIGETSRVAHKKASADWLSDEEIDRLKKWQMPIKYQLMISSIEETENSYTINLLDGYINDSSGTNKVEFKNVAELRSIMKLTHKA